jgi:hypothetical protein
MTRENLIETLVFMGDSLAQKEQVSVLRELALVHNYKAFCSIWRAMLRAQVELERVELESGGLNVKSPELDGLEPR